MNSRRLIRSPRLGAIPSIAAHKGRAPLAVLAFSAAIVSIGKFPSPGGEPERVFTSSQPAIADEILNVERRCFTASLLGTRTRSGRERRAQAGIDVVIAEGLL